MTYQPGIPTGNVKLSIDYSALQTNFQQLDTQFSVDHIPFSSTTGSPPNGYHQSIHYNPQSTTATNAPNNYTAASQYPQGVPATTVGFGQLFSSQVNDDQGIDTGLYWLSSGGKRVAMTRNFQPSPTGTGYTFLPGGLIFEWGTITITNASTGKAFTWPLEFTTLFSATLTAMNSSLGGFRVADFLNTPNSVGGTVYLKNDANNLQTGTVFFMAIGV